MKTHEIRQWMNTALVVLMVCGGAVAVERVAGVEAREAALVGDTEAPTSEVATAATPGAEAEALPEIPREVGEPEGFWTRIKRAFAYRPKTQAEENKQQVEVNVLMVEGREYFRKGEYRDALNTFKEVIQRDPYNITARRYIKECQEMLMKITLDDFDILKRERLQEVERNWLVRPRGEREVEEVTGAAVARGAVRPIDQDVQQILPSVRFTDAPLDTVLQYLYENSNPKVSIIPDPAALKALQEANQDKITLQLTEVPFIEVIKFICKTKGLTYRVDPAAVVISGKESVQLRTKVFQLSRGLDIDLPEAEGQNPTRKAQALLKRIGVTMPEGASVSFDTRRNQLRVRNTDANLKIIEEFIARYDKTPFQVQIEARFVTIRNNDMTELVFRHFLTRNYVWGSGGGKYSDRYNIYAPNLQREMTPGLRYIRSYMDETSFDPLLQTYGIPEQTSSGNAYDDYLRSKFLRPNRPPFGESDVNDAEATWQSIQQWRADLAASRREADAYLRAATRFPVGSQQYVDLMGRYSNALYTVQATEAMLAKFQEDFRLTRYQDKVADDGLGKVFDVKGVLGPAEWRSVIYALDNAEGVHTIFAPKVTVKSGQRATIRDVVKVRFNTEIDDAEDPDIEVGDAFQYITEYAVTPKNWEERDYGTTLRVTPSVQTDERTIELDVQPEISDLVAWRQFVSSRNNVFELPQFSIQSVRTVVRVNDGDTLVMGGLMRDHIMRTDDKTPILGDLPLIGRFWRGQTEVASKANLMIFLNAKLIDPSGQTRRRVAAAR
ncbi:MAG: hypothetical protein N2595_08030 [bacterium]|nr:hypothetical protein [bacterium]